MAYLKDGKVIGTNVTPPRIIGTTRTLPKPSPNSEGVDKVVIDGRPPPSDDPHWRSDAPHWVDPKDAPVQVAPPEFKSMKREWPKSRPILLDAPVRVDSERIVAPEVPPPGTVFMPQPVPFPEEGITKEVFGTRRKEVAGTSARLHGPPRTPGPPAVPDEEVPTVTGGRWTASSMSGGKVLPSGYTGDPREWGLKENLVDWVRSLKASGKAGKEDVRAAMQLIADYEAGDATLEDYTEFNKEMLAKSGGYVPRTEGGVPEASALGYSIPPPGPDEDLWPWFYRVYNDAKKAGLLDFNDFKKVVELYSAFQAGKITDVEIGEWVQSILDRGMEPPDVVEPDVPWRDRPGLYAGWGDKVKAREPEVAVPQAGPSGLEHPWVKDRVSVAPSLGAAPSTTQSPFAGLGVGGGDSPIEQLVRGGRGSRRLPVDPRIVERIQKSATMSREQSNFMEQWGGPDAYRKLVKLPHTDRLVYFAVLEGYGTPEEIEPVIDLKASKIERSLSKLTGLGLIRGS